MAIWGTNFVVIHIGLEHLPPLLFAALRFVFAVIPAIFFLKRPAVPWRNLAGYGLLIGGVQFGILFIAMNGHITPALASLVVQVQVFFTVGFAALLTGERVRPFQLIALSLAVTGMAIIFVHTDATTTTLGLVLVVIAAAGWAGGNTVARATPNVDMLAYVVWGSLFSVPPLFALSLAFEGWPAIHQALVSADAKTWFAVAYQSIANTLFGYAVWGWLLARYSVAQIAPMPLLVPVFGIAASALWLGEPLQYWKIEAALLVMSGLALNLLLPRALAYRRDRTRMPIEGVPSLAVPGTANTTPPRSE